MQGVVFMPQNPQQGSPPPNSALETNVNMEVSPLQHNHPITKEALVNESNRSDSGIYSSITNTTIDQTDIANRSTNFENCDTDNRSDCSSPERKYVCPICDRMLTSQHDFTLHIRSHNNESEVQDSEKGFTCRICNKVLSSSSSLDRHVLVHSGERPFHCKYCGDTFTTNGNMHRHMRTHSNKTESYESDGSVESNGSSSSKSIEYNNNKVDNKHTNKRKLDILDQSNNKKRENNVGDDEKQMFKCPVCERTDFNSITILENHLEDNHPEYPVKCNQCSKFFPNNKCLLLHKATVHENPTKKPPLVGFQDLTFVDFSSEKFTHIARHECEMNLHKASTGLKFQCKKCVRAFPSSKSLEIHENNCVLPPESHGGLDLSKSNSLSENDIRRMEFFNRLNLQDNSPSKTPPPLISNESPLTKLNLVKSLGMDNTKDLADIQSILSNINMLQSQNNDLGMVGHKNPSELCSDSTKNEQEEESQDVFAKEFRKMKLRGEFPCRLCTAVFPNLRALKGHNRAHLNGNNNGTYHCNMCPHYSIDKAALIRHMRTHNGDRPYECSLCNYAFTTKANCERHLRNRHAKTTREEVKRSIIYHPSEDPTNEDLNKLTIKEDPKKLNISSSTDASDLSPEKIHCSTPKLNDHRNLSEIKHEMLLKPTIPDVLKQINMSIPKEPFANINNFIRNENIKTLKEHKMIQNSMSPLIQNQFFPSPKNEDALPQNLSKIQVKNIETLKDESTPYANDSDDDYIEEEPMDLVLDLSKKKTDEDTRKQRETQESVQDLTKKPPPINPQFPMAEILTQHFLKSQPKLDTTAALYASQLAHLYRVGFPGLANWSGFHINPLLFPPSIPAPNISPDPQDIKERIQRIQLCGGSMISDNFRSFKNSQDHVRSPQFNYNGFKLDDMKNDIGPDNFSTPKKPDDLKPLALNIDNSFNENLAKLQSPIPQSKPDIMQSPNSVKMVIKNGVLMPKQKQRRYRTERPFTCEHCSARFTLRSNMERHIKQQHPQFWSQRQRGNVGNPGRKSQGMPLKSTYCDISIPNYDLQKTHDMAERDTKEEIAEKLKFAILTQQLQSKHLMNHQIKKEEDDDCALIIDENEEKNESKTDKNHQREDLHYEGSRILEEKLTQCDVRQKTEKTTKIEESQDLVPVSRLLDNASQQQFKEYFKRDGEENEIGAASEEEEEGFLASGSTSEGNISGNDENRSESDTAAPVKKKSAYSLAPNRVSCPYCSRKFPWTSSLRRHILTHTGQKPFKCSHCPLLFTTKSNCDRHLLRKHGNTASTISNDTANNNTNYLMRNVPERPFKCSSCPSSTFSTYSNLKKHISCKHSTNAQGDDIKAQGYEAGSSEDEKVTNNFETKNEWENQLSHTKVNIISNPDAQNMQVANSDLPFKCHLCEGSFSERQDALDHIRDKHASEYDLLMSKNALDTNATTPDDVNHQDDEDSEIRGKFPDYSNRKVICAFCMRRFWSAEDLRRHMRTHTGERPFSCDICRRRFTLKHSMLRHRKKHNINFENDNNISDEDGNNVSPIFDKFVKGDNNNSTHKLGEKSDESDGNEGGDLISNLLGIRDRSIIDKVLGASADDAAKLLGVKNGVRE